jgi:hypothetical protein
LSEVTNFGLCIGGMPSLPGPPSRMRFRLIECFRRLVLNPLNIRMMAGDMCVCWPLTDGSLPVKQGFAGSVICERPMNKDRHKTNISILFLIIVSLLLYTTILPE